MVRGLFLLLPALLLSAQQPPPLRTFYDAADHLTLQLPPTWLIATRDRELSTFHQEARTAPRTARLRLVAAMPENPFPESTFSGAHFYLSAIPAQTAAQCAAQAGPTSPEPPTLIAGLPATHGHDEHGPLCTQYRDDTYTLRRNRVCLRFDLAMNNFCGGEVSGVRDLTPGQIRSIEARLQAILQTLRFDP